MRLLLTVIKIVFCLVLFIFVQYSTMSTLGLVDWFFDNFPESKSPWDFPVLYIFSAKPVDYILPWVPLVCLASSLLFFMKRQNSWGFFTILSPFFVCVFIMIFFTLASQMHVPPGQGLYSSGVLIGKVESHILKQERLARESAEDSKEDQINGD